MISDGRDRMMKALADRPLGHTCCICGARAPFGLGPHGARPEAARWYCLEHALPRWNALHDRAEPAALQVSEATGAAVAPPPPKKQGSLF